VPIGPDFFNLRVDCRHSIILDVILPTADMNFLKPLLTVFLFCSFCNAQSFVSKLPVDGVTATYGFKKTETNRFGDVTKFQGIVELRTLGTKEIEDQKFRWLEIESHEFNKDIPSNGGSILKILIPEESIKRSKNIVFGAKIAWQCHYDLKNDTKEITQLLNPKKHLAPWLVPPKNTKFKSIANRRIKTSIGTLNAKGNRCSYQITSKDSKSEKNEIHKMELTYYTNDQSPFGGVEMTSIRTADERITAQTLTLKSFEHKAVSSLPKHWLLAK